MIKQKKLQEFYQAALRVAGWTSRYGELREWFIRHRKELVQRGDFRLDVVPVPTMCVDLKKLRARIDRMSPEVRAKFKRILRGCVTRGKTFRVDVKVTTLKREVHPTTKQ